MERDFLGMKGELRNITQDAASLNPGMQWPFANKAWAMHQFMSYKVAQEERQKKHAVNPGVQSMPTVDAFEASGKTFPTQAQQKCFSLARDAANRFPMHAYNQSQRSENWGASAHLTSEPKTFPVVSHPAVPVAMSSSYFKLHGNQTTHNNAISSLKQQPYGGATTHTQIGSSMAGGPASLMPKPTPMTAQLTIFYAGSVNVFDDVTLEMAQEIMSVATKRSNAPPRSSRPEAGIQAAIPVPMKVAPSNGLITKKTMKAAPTRVASPCSGLSSPKSVSSHNGANPQSSSSTTDDAAGAKPVTPLAKINQEEPSKTMTEALGTASTPRAMPRAVPQARKASLARFLEKRKARVISVLPYSSSKKITDTGTTFENGKMPSISSVTDVNLSSSRENFWCFGHAKGNITSGEYPSTKLEI